MLLGCGVEVVVEVVNHQRIAVRGEVNIEFEEERGDLIGGRRIARECEKYIAFRFQVVENDVRSEARSVCL